MNLKYSTLGFDKVYVINLERRKDRKELLLKNYPNIDFTFIEAIDGKSISIPEFIEKGIINNTFYDPNGILTLGVFGCALSHKKAWDQAIQDGVNNALFLEDDILIEKIFDNFNNFTPEYQEILSEITKYNYDIVHLGKKTPTSEGMNVGKYLTVSRFGTGFHGAHAYAVNRETIKELSNQYLPIKYAADVYIEQFNHSHNLYNVKTSLIRQASDFLDPHLADSDTYRNDYRDGGGKVGISFDEKGNIIDKTIANYLIHPPDTTYEYIGLVLERPKFGTQKINPKTKVNKHFFSITNLLSYLRNKIKIGGKMIEINSHLGESTFFFGSSNLFSNIYTIDEYKGEDKFNIENNLTWDQIKTGFHSNTYFFEDIISHLEMSPIDALDIIENNSIEFIYINNRKQQNIQTLINQYLPKLTENGIIGGDNIEDAPEGSKTFEDGSWTVNKRRL